MRRRARASCCDRHGRLKKGPWTPEEDKKLQAFIQSNNGGHGNWRSLPQLAGLDRCGKSCRLRWTNYLRPDIKRGPFTKEEENSIIWLHGLLGNRWAAIAAKLPGRTDNEIKNYWNTCLRKRLLKMGLDPESLLSSEPNPTVVRPKCPSTRHKVEWESVRLETEARLSSDQTLPGSVNGHPDRFLRLWHSKVGDLFRRASVRGQGINKGTFGCSPASSSTRCVSGSVDDEASDAALELLLDYPCNEDSGLLQDGEDY